GVLVLLMALGALLSSRRIWLLISLVNNLALLLFFKYARFVVENLNAVFAGFHVAVRLPDPSTLMPFGFEYLLPVGISFFTFQSLSYTIDFYLGNVQRERNFLRLQRLHGHGPRRREAHGFPFDFELQQSLPRHRAGRFLVALAHQPFHLVPGLRLYSARRKQTRDFQHVPESVFDLFHLRHLARGGLDLLHLGNPPRAGRDDHTRIGAVRLLPDARPAIDETTGGVCVREFRLDFFPRRIAERCPADRQPHLHRRLA